MIRADGEVGTCWRAEVKRLTRALDKANGIIRERNAKIDLLERTVADLRSRCEILAEGVKP